MRQIILGLIFITTGAYSQTNKYNLKNYPSDKFKVTSDTTKMIGFNVVLIAARPIVESVAQYQGTKVWVQRLCNGKLTERYLGEIETERGVYRPYSQPLKNAYIIVECGEYEGQINLITKDGDFVIIPGYYYALNKHGHIYTRQANLDSLVYRYDLKNKKGTDLRAKNVTVDNLLFDEVKGAYWVK
ncbi:MAG: hypothetical protein ACKO96_38685 [Flammeovirgaceae bacterium]